MRIILDNYAPPDFVRKPLDNTPLMWYNIHVSGILIVLQVRNLTLLVRHDALPLVRYY